MCRYADELVGLSPDVFVAAGGAIVSVLQRVSRTVPIVFAQSIDPVGAASPRAWRVRAATPLASHSSNTA